MNQYGNTLRGNIKINKINNYLTAINCRVVVGLWTVGRFRFAKNIINIFFNFDQFLGHFRFFIISKEVLNGLNSLCYIYVGKITFYHTTYFNQADDLSIIRQ